MKNKYLLTRFIAFLLYDEQKLKDEKGGQYIYKNDIDEFLGKGMETLNMMDDWEIEKIEQLVTEILEKSYFYLGEDAFRLTKGERRSPINMNVFETVMYALWYIPADEEKLQPKVSNKILQLLDSVEFRDNIGNHRDSVEKINWRLKIAGTIGRSFV